MDNGEFKRRALELARLHGFKPSNVATVMVRDGETVCLPDPQILRTESREGALADFRELLRRNFPL